MAFTYTRVERLEAVKFFSIHIWSHMVVL